MAARDGLQATKSEPASNGEDAQPADAPTFAEKLKAATRACLEVAQARAQASPCRPQLGAHRAQVLADEESAKIRFLTASLVELQMQKIELKLRLLDDLHGTIARESQNIDSQRKKLLLERQQFLEQKRAAEQVCIAQCVAPLTRHADAWPGRGPAIEMHHLQL